MIKPKICHLAIVPIFALSACGDDDPNRRATPTQANQEQIIRHADGSYQKKCQDGSLVKQNESCPSSSRSSTSSSYISKKDDTEKSVAKSRGGFGSYFSGRSSGG